MKNKPVGAVMVVGGGIGGIQASLDLAESGYKVYLVESKPSIGGVMAQLDKTFPTNDCSMCILSPKLVDCGRHKDIELITYAEVMGVEGEPGNFSVRLKKHARYVDLAKCTGCGECVEKCPVSLPDEFNQELNERKAIYRLYPQAIPNVFTIEKGETPPCRDACPAGVNVQGYVALISQGKFKESLELIRERNPFVAVCGRVCHHPCEEKCNRKDVDEPIAIRPLKRFVADYVMAQKEEEPAPVEITREEKIAIVGAGPCGLTAAADLVRLGYPVTVFDSSDTPGGMIQSCLPDYRIPGEMAEYDINRLLKLGIELKKRVSIGRDLILDGLKEQGYKAILLAIGCQFPKKLPIEGHDAEGVLYGITFLKDTKAGKPSKTGNHIIVIGGGNVAIDCAKSALRLGAKEVHLVCLETRDLTSKDRMPAHDWEIEEAEEEGVILHPCFGPKRILVNGGKVSGLQTVECSSVYEEDGRFNPKFKEGTESVLEGDTIIIAIGQDPDFTGFQEFEKTPWKTFKVDEITLETTVPGIFAGGDIVSGPASVVEAVAQGHEAAISIDRYIQGADLKEGREKKEIKTAEKPEKEIELKKRQDLPKRPAKIRSRDFKEIELEYAEEEIAIEEAKRCLNCGICSECLQCVEACEADAIDHTQKEEEGTIEVGAILLIPGFQAFNPEGRPQYGYKKFPNVITSLEYERILSASGPFEGKVIRPFDNKPPKKIAFIQCVGSREEEKNYCSSVCCMYSTKEAIITKEHAPGVEPTIFYMDMRAYGKEFDKYIDRAEKEYGVKYVRCRITEVEEISETKDLKIRYEREDGELQEEIFNLVILSVGLEPGKDVKELSKRLNIELNKYGFIRTNRFSPEETNKPGIYVCGASSEPKDIPETVTQASAAAAKASALLSPARGTLLTEKVYPEEIDISDQEPRIGAFICHCGINIGGVVDVPQVVEFAKTLPNVIYAEDNLYTCSQDTQEKIKEKIAEHKLNRVVVASCTPRTHEPLFQETIREAGLNPYLFQLANIRDQCSWVHQHQPEVATEKAKDLVAMAVAKARLLKPLHPASAEVTHSALVIGGGLAGLTASETLAEQGYEVYLVEKEAELGGNLREIYYTLEGLDPQELLRTIVERVQANELIHIYTGAEIKEISGYVGNFKTTIETKDQRPKTEDQMSDEVAADFSLRNREDPGSRIQNPESTIELEHGVVIVATGAQEYKPKEYLYGKDDRVITQRDFEKRLSRIQNPESRIQNVVMIQCVGSRDDEHPYCSRVCCTDGIKNALKLKEIKPDVNIFILYRDVRTYGAKEKYYRKARDKGVIFIRYEEDSKPEVRSSTNGIGVKIRDPILEREIEIETDILVLSVCMVPGKDTPELAKMLKVPLNSDGFFLEAHVKLRPVDFATEGIFMAGTCHSPKCIDETISQANAAVSRACTIISKDTYTAEATISSVNEDICAGCGACESICAYGAPKIVIKDGKRVSEVNEALCKGCGNCVGACPSGAMQQLGFKSEQTLAMLNTVLSE